MKKLVLFATCMATLCIHGATTEESRQKVRKCVEELVELWKRPFRDGLYYSELIRDLYAIDRDVRWTVYFEMIEKNFDNPDIMNQIMEGFYVDDGCDYASYGNQETLDLARKVAKNGWGLANTRSTQAYLMNKGDARDLDIIEGDYRDTLAMRVAGANIINHGVSFWEKQWFGCIPSVTNTGTQGLYVNAILRQYWENMEVDSFIFDGRPISLEERSKLPAEILAILDSKNVTYDGRSYTNTYKDKRKIPQEIQSLVVWFDEDGNPVCNVDLAKYGLTMPELDMPNRPKGKPKAAATLPPPPEKPVTATRDETPPITITEDEPNEEKNNTNLLWLYVGILSALCAGVVLWRIRRRKS